MCKHRSLLARALCISCTKYTLFLGDFLSIGQPLFFILLLSSPKKVSVSPQNQNKPMEISIYYSCTKEYTRARARARTHARSYKYLKIIRNFILVQVISKSIQVEDSSCTCLKRQSKSSWRSSRSVCLFTPWWRSRQQPGQKLQSSMWMMQKIKQSGQRHQNYPIETKA